MAWPVRRYFRLLWCTLCLLTFLLLPLTIWEFQRQHYDVHRQAWFIGGIFAILSVPISIYEIALHTEYYTQPQLQKHVIRILLMVPIYAVDAWLALKFKEAREYLDPIRECYEAFVVYSFLAYLMAYLQETYVDLEAHMRQKPQVQHLFIARWFLKPWDMGTRFLWECKKGVLNFVIIRPICTSLAFVTDIFDDYGRGQINFKKSYVYLAAVTNFSQMWALYCLVMLYHAMHSELAPIRPLSKFLCIKAVIFVTFWQGVTIAILVHAGVIRQESWYDTQNVAAGLQDFLICIEMFLAALAHAYAFPPRDYMGGYSRGFFANVAHIFNWRDVVDDVGRVVEEHVTTAATAVVKAPKRAVKKAALGLARTKQLFGTSKGSPGGRSTDDEEQPGSGYVLLRPPPPVDPPFVTAGGSGSRGPGSGSGIVGGLGAPAAATAAVLFPYGKEDEEAGAVLEVSRSGRGATLPWGLSAPEGGGAGGRGGVVGDAADGDSAADGGGAPDGGVGGLAEPLLGRVHASADS